MASNALALLAGLATLVPMAGCAPAAVPPDAAAARTIRISTGPADGDGRPIANALERIFESRLSGVAIEVLEGTTIPNLQAVVAGGTDVASASADVVYAAFTDGLPGQSTPATALRAIAMLRPNPLNLLVQAESSIHQVSDLRGRFVASGTPGNNAAVHRVLDAFALETEKILQGPVSAAQAIEALEAGRVDAAFVRARYPSRLIQGATDRGARLVPLDGKPVERFLREYPFYVGMFIPGGLYKGHPGPVRTVGVSGILVCRDDQDEQLVYDLTRVLFEALEEETDPGSSLDWFDRDRPEAAPIPLHAGAARYYRERSLFR
jgi:TRAP transporter TAXI family solute receptor